MLGTKPRVDEDRAGAFGRIPTDCSGCCLAFSEFAQALNGLSSIGSDDGCTRTAMITLCQRARNRGESKILIVLGLFQVIGQITRCLPTPRWHHAGNRQHHVVAI